MNATRYDLIRGTFPDLDGWAQRLGVAYVPQTGSELADDDLDWPVMSVSHVAVSSMAAAQDHLQAVRIHIDARQFFPFAQASLVRTATLSAAQAVWVLAPDRRDDRVSNARTLAQHMYEQHLLFLRDLQALAASPHAGTDAVEAHVAQRLAKLSAKRSADGQKSRFEATRTIEVAALATWGRPMAALEAKVEWRRGSAAAHGLMWSVLGRPETRRAGAPDAGGVAPFEAGGGIDALANPYMCAHGLLAKAFDLLDARGGSASGQVP